MKRVMAGSVTVIGEPLKTWSTNSGMTEPRDAITLPYRVPQMTVPEPSRLREVATITFSGGDVVEKLAVRKAAAGDRNLAGEGPRDRKSGTSVRVWPDAKYFESAELPRGELVHLLRSKAVLMPGVVVTLTVEKTGDHEVTFTFSVKGNRELPQITGQLPVLPKHWWEGTDARGKKRDITSG